MIFLESPCHSALIGTNKMQEKRWFWSLTYLTTPSIFVDDHQFRVAGSVHTLPVFFYNLLSSQPNHPLMIFLESPCHSALIGNKKLQKSGLSNFWWTRNFGCVARLIWSHDQLLTNQPGVEAIHLALLSPNPDTASSRVYLKDFSNPEHFQNLQIYRVLGLRSAKKCRGIT
jgi:hypothetical protein